MKKIKIISGLVLVLIFLCAYDKFSETPVFDLKNDIVYECVMADDIISLFETDHDAARNKYNNNAYAVLGHINSISSDYKSFTITCVGSYRSRGTIECPVNDTTLQDKLKSLYVGQNVFVFCSISVDTWSNWWQGNITGQKVSQIIETDEDYVDNSCYMQEDGTRFETNLGNKIVLMDEDGTAKVVYYIDDEWDNVQYDIPPADDGKYDIEGYYYKLNELPGDFDSNPENLFVFYFDNSSFVESRNEYGNSTKIMAEIVNNILECPGECSKYDLKASTQYGVKWYQYATHYYDKNGKFHRVDFIFAPVADKTEGLVVIMYVYSDDKHLNDVLYLIRTLKLY